MTTTHRQPRRTKTIDSIVSGRTDRRVGLAYKLADGGLAMDVMSNPTFDESTMSATAVISTPTIDRVGDLLIPQGCRLDNYRKNPVVLWNHGFEDGKPIGKSVDPSGNLSVRIPGDMVEATCYFSPSLREASQIFELIVEGIVKATSVRETPIVSSYKRDPEFGDILIVEEWELEEWSWVPVGCNPDAVAKALHIGKLAGSPISATVLKSLQSIAPQRQAVGKGLDLKVTEMAKSYTAAALKAMSTAALKAAKEDASEEAVKMIDEEEKRRKADGEEEPPADDGAPANMPAEEPGEEEDSGNTPYGSQLLTAIHASLADAVGNIEAGLGPLENVEVKQALTELVGSLNDAKTQIEGLYSSSYPEGKGLKVEPEQDAEALKSFLASAQMPRFQVGGMGLKLKALASAKNLQPAQRKAIAEVISGLGRLVNQAKAAKAPAPVAPEPSAEDAASLKRIETAVNSLKALIPAK